MFINFEDQFKKLDDIRTGKLKEAPKLGIDDIDNVIRFKKILLVSLDTQTLKDIYNHLFYVTICYET